MFIKVGVTHTYVYVLLQLRLSEIVEGTQCLFIELADKSDVFSARVTPQSFHEGLMKKKVSLFAYVSA